MKAKTKFSLITVLNAILCVVFAFIAGITYCAGGVTRIESNLNSTMAYASNNKYKVLNSTIDNPVMFGETTNNVKIAVDYSLYYDFDIRVSYSLSWTDTTLSTDNVILTFAGRDRFIVDDQYIFLTSKMLKGKGTLNIINGVQFADPTDEKYIGQTLTINAQVEIVKAVDYSSVTDLKNNTDLNVDTRDLYVDSIAGNAWAKVRTNSMSKQTRADIIVYNSRFNAENGIALPDRTAYYSKYDSDGNLEEYKKLYGNRYYAGAGMFVMTGSESVQITVKSIGTWEFVGDYQYIKNQLPIFQKNTYYSKVDDDYTLLDNAPENWQLPSVYTQYYTKDSGGQFTQNTIPAWGTDKYYTSEGVLLTEEPADWEINYTNYCVKYAPAAFDNNIFYNFNQDIGWGTVSYDANNATSTIVVGAGKIVFIPIFDSIEITSVMNTSSSLLVDYTDYRLVSTFSINNTTMPSVKIHATSLEGSDVAETINNNSWTISNNTLYNPGLFDESAGLTQNYYTDLSLTNNTNVTKTYTVNYSTRYTLSNGSQTGGNGPSDELNSTAWARVSNIYGSATTKVVKVAPYATVSLESTHEVPQALVGGLSYCDAWIDYAVSVTETGTTESENAISIETKLEENEVKYYVRNNSNTTVIVPETNITMSAWTYSYSELEKKPKDWDITYWKYYYLSNGNYIPANSKTEWRDDVTFYQRSEKSNNIELTVSEQILLPNASAYVGSVSKIQIVSSVTYTMDRFVSVKTISANTSTQTVGIVETGTANAYLVNTSSTTSYYVRFTGTCVTNENVVSDGDYNYYIGILRPGQIVEIPMTTAGVVEMSMSNGDVVIDGIIKATGDYSESSLSVWNLNGSSNVLTAFNAFFN